MYTHMYIYIYIYVYTCICIHIYVATDACARLRGAAEKRIVGNDRTRATNSGAPRVKMGPDPSSQLLDMLAGEIC